MKRHLFTGLAALLLLNAPAQADELEFESVDLEAMGTTAAQPEASNKSQDAEKRLEVPAQAAQIPIQSAEPSEPLPPPPTVGAIAPTPLPIQTASEISEIEAAVSTSSSSDSLALSFELQPNSNAAPALSPTPEVPTSTYSPAPSQPTASKLDDFFKGGSDSLVAVAIGSAEGTRTPTGDRTAAYAGHVDPGNQVWNRGSFSYQHEARSPEDADQKQLNRLRQQADVLHQQATSKGMDLTLEEWINALDLANQAPAAALERGGYLDWLHQAHAIGLRDTDAILWARVRSFLDPDTRQWNAPGLGNNIHSISQDQERRMTEIQKAIAAQAQKGDRLPNTEPVQQAIAQAPLQALRSRGVGIDRILNFAL